jgi:hypothetical protein
MTLGSVISGKCRTLLAVLTLAGLLLGGLYCYSTLHSGLGSVAMVMPELAPSIPTNMFVQPDYQRLPIQTADYAAPGHYTVVIFHQQRCPDCQRLDRQLEEFQKYRKDVAVRKIDLGPHWSSEGTVRDFGRKIWWTPFVVIYGPDAKLLQTDDAGKRDAWKLLNKWIAYELGKDPR